MSKRFWFDVLIFLVRSSLELSCIVEFKLAHPVPLSSLYIFDRSFSMGLIFLKMCRKPLASDSTFGSAGCDVGSMWGPHAVEGLLICVVGLTLSSRIWQIAFSVTSDIWI